MTTKVFDISHEGKNLRLRISANDLTVERLSRAFQVSNTEILNYESHSKNMVQYKVIVNVC